jgi:hypothetical protein
MTYAQFFIGLITKAWSFYDLGLTIDGTTIKFKYFFFFSCLVAIVSTLLRINNGQPHGGDNE